jgi:hypothetical protein
VKERDKCQLQLVPQRPAAPHLRVWNGKAVHARVCVTSPYDPLYYCRLTINKPEHRGAVLKRPRLSRTSLYQGHVTIRDMNHVRHLIHRHPHVVEVIPPAFLDAFVKCHTERPQTQHKQDVGDDTDHWVMRLIMPR